LHSGNKWNGQYGKEPPTMKPARLFFAFLILSVLCCTQVNAANPDWPKSLTVATASPGGVYYVYGQELARILTEKLGIPVNSLATQGAIQNVKLLDMGGAQLATITMSTGQEGWNGTGAWTDGKKFRNIRALFPMYDNAFQPVALRKSGITTLAQLDQKRVGAGPPSGNVATYGPVIFKIVGISPQMIYGSYEDMAAELLDGRVDAMLTVLGVPAPAIEHVEATEPVNLLGLSAEQLQAIVKAIPDFSPSTIPAGTYGLQSTDYMTVAVPNFVVGRADIPNDLVYELTKAVFESRSRLVKKIPEARDTVAQNVVKDTFLPFHPGAVRYYREIGIKIPEALEPTN
jgi:uncharacterized protein